MNGVITISTDNRMKEIAGNLKRDVKDLLNESANIIAGFFKQGLCTVRGAATRWKKFTHGISESVGMLFQPFENALPPAPPLDSQPMVTVMESDDPEMPVGTRMTLHEVETKIDNRNYAPWSVEDTINSVTLAIDYIMEGEQDRYWLSLKTGPGCRPMLDQMESYVTDCFARSDFAKEDFYKAPEGLGALLCERFGPQLQSDLEKLSTKVLHFFRQHSNISRMEQQFEIQTQAMPEKEREKFTRSMSETVVSLRRAANTGQVQPVAPGRAQEQPSAQPDHQPTSRARSSVKMKLTTIKAGQKKGSAPKRDIPMPQR